MSLEHFIEVHGIVLPNFDKNTEGCLVEGEDVQTFLSNESKTETNHFEEPRKFTQEKGDRRCWKKGMGCAVPGACLTCMNVQNAVRKKIGVKKDGHRIAGLGSHYGSRSL